MGLGHKRADLRAVAQAKLDDAVLLLRHGRHSNAYYLAGYAIEIGLKACIAAQFTAETIPDKNFVNDIFRHDLRKLVGLAGLTSELKRQQDADDVFSANWTTVCEWLPEARYQSIDPTTSQFMITAVVHERSGVLPWIKQHW